MSRAPLAPLASAGSNRTAPPPRPDSRAPHVRPSRWSGADTLLPTFAIAFAAGILAPVFAHGFFPLYRTLPWSQLIDFFTPVVLLPLYWLLFASAGAAAPSRRESVVFLIGASLWALGHGVHLAANSIGYAMRPLPPSYASELAHLYDEVLGHYFWHAGIVALSALITIRAARAGRATTGVMLDGSAGATASTSTSTTSTTSSEARSPHTAGARNAGLRGAARFLAALLYGFTYFLVIVEGGTAPIGVPFAALFVIVSLARSRATLARRPIHAFFFAAHLFALLLFAIWAGIHSGLPQFSEVGIID